MRTNILLLFFLTVTTLNSFATTSKEIVLETPSGQLFGTIINPSDNPYSSIAIIIAGSGPTDRNGNNPAAPCGNLQQIAEQLAIQKIATLRFDKRGIGASAKAGPNERELRFTTYTDDVKAWIFLLSKTYRNIFILGHSEGATIGLIASKNNPHVKGYISLAGPADKASKILSKQLITALPPSLNITANNLIRDIERGKFESNVPKQLYGLFRPSVQPYLHSWFKIDPVKEMAALTIPVLILQGDLDLQIETKQAELLAAANTKAQMYILPTINHLMKPVSQGSLNAQLPTYQSKQIVVSTVVTDHIATFIRNTVKK